MAPEKILFIVRKRIGVPVVSIFIAAIALAPFGLGLCGSAQAEEDQKTLFGDFLKGADIGVSATVAYNSKYVWRGFKLDDDPVLQPSITISAFQGWAVSVWSNFDLENEDDLNSDETDTILTYSHTFENLNVFGAQLRPVTMTVGHTYYDFSGTGLFSKETLLTVGYATFLNPFLTWNHDYGDEEKGGGNGDYIVLNLNHSIPLVPDYGITFDLSGHTGYNNELYLAGQGGDVMLTAGFTVPLTKNFAVQPSVNWSSPLDDMRDEEFANQDDEFYWGVVFNYAM